MQSRKYFTFFFILLPFCCFCQNTEKVPLTIVLEEIAKLHGAKFSYIDEELAVYALVPPDAKLSLASKLDYIEKHTRLKFEAVNTMYYTVYNDIRMDKPLCGYLIDAETGQGIENAEIEITALSVSVASGANGYFTLPVLTPNEITVKHLGYKSKTLNPQDLYIADCPNIILEPAVHELQELITDRYLATGISKKETGELVVKPRRFGILPGLTEPDILQTMQQIPGINSIDETVSNINVRGGTHDQNLFLWNGVRIYQTGHFFGLISAFNPLPATNISIFKNGTPAFFGEGVSSLVNISTHITVPDSSFTTVAADMINVNLLTLVKFSDKAALQLSGRRTYADFFSTPTFKNYEERAFQNTTVTAFDDNLEIPVKSDEDFYFYDFSLQYQQQIGKQHQMIINGIRTENDLEVDQQTSSANKKSSLSQKSYGGSINLKSQWGSAHETEVQAYVSWYDLTAANEAIESEQITNQRNNILDEGFRARYTYKGFESLQLSTGYQFNEVGVTNFDEVNTPVFSRKNKEVSVSHSIIGEGKYVTKDELTSITAGIRANYFEKFSILIAEPRLAISRILTNTLKAEVTGEQKSQTLSQIIDRQQDFLGIEKRRWVLANENDIPIQRSSQISLGMAYNFNGWFASIEGFYKKITGITSDSQGFQNQFEFANAKGEYSVAGTEILLQKNFRQFYTWISYSYNDNQYHFEGFLPPGFSNNFAISHTAAFAGIYEWNKLRIALGTKWHTGKPVTEPLDVTIDPNNPANSAITYHSPNNSRLKDNFHINFSASKTWIFKKDISVTASCSVLNILDRKNIINRYYRINRANNSAESVNTYSLGRTPNLSLKFTF